MESNMGKKVWQGQESVMDKDKKPKDKTPLEPLVDGMTPEQWKRHLERARQQLGLPRRV